MCSLGFVRRSVRKKYVVGILLVIVPFLIFLNGMTRRTKIPNTVISNKSRSFAQQNSTKTVENISKIMRQPSPTSKGLHHTCDIPLDNSKMAQRFPHIIIIGFGKSGTRALYQMIRMHPDVVGPSQELRFFSNDLKYKQGIHAYTKLMPATTETQKTIEKSPDYIIKPGTAERLKKAIDHCHRSDIKFIVVLREPFRRAVSEYLEWKLYVQHHMGKTLRNFERLAIKKSGEVNKFHSQVRLL